MDLKEKFEIDLHEGEQINGMARFNGYYWSKNGGISKQYLRHLVCNKNCPLSDEVLTFTSRLLTTCGEVDAVSFHPEQLILHFLFS